MNSVHIILKQNDNDLKNWHGINRYSAEELFIYLLYYNMYYHKRK